jgi:hypothetical protein
MSDVVLSRLFFRAEIDVARPKSLGEKNLRLQSTFRQLGHVAKTGVKSQGRNVA